MSDLATSLDAQGHLDEACFYVQRASDLARQTEHPELHMVLSNLAAILMHRGREGATGFINWEMVFWEGKAGQ